MKILIINSGSSSIKFQLILMPEQKVLASGMVERIGLEGARIEMKIDDKVFERKLSIENHEKGLEIISHVLLDAETGVLTDASEIDAVGHRVVHGGSAFSKTVVI